MQGALELGVLEARNARSSSSSCSAISPTSSREHAQLIIAVYELHIEEPRSASRSAICCYTLLPNGFCGGVSCSITQSDKSSQHPSLSPSNVSYVVAASEPSAVLALLLHHPIYFVAGPRLLHKKRRRA